MAWYDSTSAGTLTIPSGLDSVERPFGVEQYSSGTVIIAFGSEVTVTGTVTTTRQGTILYFIQSATGTWEGFTAANAWSVGPFCSYIEKTLQQSQIVDFQVLRDGPGRLFGGDALRLSRSVSHFDASSLKAA